MPPKYLQVIKIYFLQSNINTLGHLEIICEGGKESISNTLTQSSVLLHISKKILYGGLVIIFLQFCTVFIYCKVIMFTFYFQ